ncbi:MAG: hypothetical protein N2112_12905 [Gemmataceae bacterium]|nr:hypothetical protein [Gemmataceae bacterium]
MRATLTFAALLWASVALADVPAPVVPSEVKGSVGEFITVKADCKNPVQWYAVSSGLKLFPVELLKDTKTAVVTANKAGRYELLCWTAEGNEPSKATKTVTIVVDDNGPTPPVPPTPPTPPVPPDSTFYNDLKRLYDADKSEDKQTTLSKLTGFYKALLSYIDKPNSVTVGDFRNDWQAAMSEVLGDIPADVLADCRRLIGQRIGAALGVDPEAKLDPTIRPKAKSALTEITTALDKLNTLEKRKNK